MSIIGINCDTVDGHHAREMLASTQRWSGDIADTTVGSVSSFETNAALTGSTWVPAQAGRLDAFVGCELVLPDSSAQVRGRIRLENVTDATDQFSQTPEQKVTAAGDSVSYFIRKDDFSLISGKTYQLSFQVQQTGSVQNVGVFEGTLTGREYATE